MIKQQQSEGHGSVVSTRRKAPSYSFLSCFCPPVSPKGRVLDILLFLMSWDFFFCEYLVPKSIILLSRNS